MKVTRQKVAQKLVDYINHRITLEELVDWAESMLMEEKFEEHDLEMLRDIVSRMGLADVRAFGMAWEDCENFLSRLGYRVSVTISETAATA